MSYILDFSLVYVAYMPQVEQSKLELFFALTAVTPDLDKGALIIAWVPGALDQVSAGGFRCHWYVCGGATLAEHTQYHLQSQYL